MIGITFATLLIASTVRAGTVVWDGSFDAYTSAADFDAWSFSNPVGEYQWYIHGSGDTSTYLGLDPSFKNLASTQTNGLRATIDGTALWNGQTMERTELIPQTSENLGTGNLFYHFSVSRSDTNAPDSSIEHQVAFFESHFTELKYGVGDEDLHWFVGGTSQWSTAFDAGTWYNFAYDIDFDAGTVALWASTGSDELTQVVEPVSASTSTNSADWHVGVLKLSTAAVTEDWFFSGVYIEDAPATTSVGSGSSSGGSETSAAASTSVVASTSAAASTSADATTEIASSSAEATSTVVAAAPSSSAVETSAAASTTAAATSAPAETSAASTSVVDPSVPADSTSAIETTSEFAETSTAPASSSSAPIESSAPASSAVETSVAAPSSVAESSAPATSAAETSAPVETSIAASTSEAATSASSSSAVASSAAPSTSAVQTSAPATSVASSAASTPTGFSSCTANASGVVDANCCMNEYNKCLAASQPNPDFTGCSAAKDTCMTSATYNYNMAGRAKRDGKFGRLLL